jgi:hypothetical protein
VQVPALTSVAVVPETVQTAGVCEAKLTGKPELADALRLSGVPSTWVGIGLNVMVWLFRPEPLRVMVWVAGLPFNELSVSVAEPVIGPVEVGVKLRLRLQFSPEVREELLLQSAGVPEPAICAKLEPTVSPLSETGPLPIFSTVTDCGLSLLVLPTGVAAKLRAGGCDRSTSATRLL